MTDTARDLIQRLADMADALDGRKPLVFAQGQVMDGFTALANFQALANEARAFLAQPEPPGLPPDYIDSEHTGHDREMLEEFYRACRSEGGSADEIHLRGLKAVIALAQPEPEGPTEDEILDLSEEHGVSYTTLGGVVIHPYQEVVDIKDDVLSFAHALIAADRARWGRTTTETP